jgi:glucose-6-phosphate dehydrogenase-like protein
MKLKFYGTRGSSPVCDAGFQEFGGNTTCVRLAFPDTQTIAILDAGTGISREPYDRLVVAAMAGEPLSFARQDEAEAAKRIIDPILVDQPPVRPYEPGTWGPQEADVLIAPIDPGTTLWHPKAAGNSKLAHVRLGHLLQRR